MFWVPLLAATGVLGIPLHNPTSNHEGFHDSSVTFSAGGQAVCIIGNVEVAASTNANEKLLINEPPNQAAVTEAVVEYLQINSSVAAEVNGGPSTIFGTYTINAKLCYPKDWSPSKSSKTIQFLIHGILFDKSYWDFAEGYSFVDIAAAAGYPTFSYDRLGVGLSDHPDPIQVVQSPLQVEIAHVMIQSLRAGKFAGQKFDHVVGVGHSFGSIQTVGVTARYPKDYDAIVLTGFSLALERNAWAVAGFDVAIASQNQPSRFGSLPNGYLVTDTLISDQYAYARYPNYDPAVFARADENKQTFTFGEIFTLTTPISPSPSFTGPVDVVDGSNDFIFCQGDCQYPVNQAALVQPSLYPAASNGSESALFPGVGHGITVHYDSYKVYKQVQQFVVKNGL